LQEKYEELMQKDGKPLKYWSLVNQDLRNDDEDLLSARTMGNNGKPLRMHGIKIQNRHLSLKEGKRLRP